MRVGVEVTFRGGVCPFVDIGLLAVSLDGGRSVPSLVGVEDRVGAIESKSLPAPETTAISVKVAATAVSIEPGATTVPSFGLRAVERAYTVAIRLTVASA